MSLQWFLFGLGSIFIEGIQGKFRRPTGSLFTEFTNSSSMPAFLCAVVRLASQSYLKRKDENIAIPTKHVGIGVLLRPFAVQDRIEHKSLQTAFCVHST
ncbi:hypothetical protein BD779DRAFT_114557 [Infundibulicybe gibba]|nr:hypothetical protein BD779DRAFT_114557 [Infundibulicybe gibba]